MSVEKGSPVHDGDGVKGRERSAWASRNPHSCAKCGARWSSLRLAHCGACCRSFVSVGVFDKHRSPEGQHGTCLDPADAGLEFRDGLWRGPAMSDEKRERLYGRSA